MTVHAIVYQEGDHFWGYFKEFPNVFGDGSSTDEVLTKLQEAITTIRLLKMKGALEKYEKRAKATNFIAPETNFKEMRIELEPA